MATVGTSLTGAVLMVAFGAAVARNDDGSKTFFQAEAAASSVAAEAAGHVTQAVRWARDLTVGTNRRAGAGLPRELHTAARHKRRDTEVAAIGPSQRGAAQPLLAAVRPVPGKATPATIYTDRTLRPGDAVMTGAGIRIFAGSVTFPYQAADFVTLKQAAGLSRRISGVLASIDSLPRS